MTPDEAKNLAPGDLVTIPQIKGMTGTVTRVSQSHIEVHWDDGKDGLLYFDGSCAADTKNLQLVWRASLKARG